MTLDPPRRTFKDPPPKKGRLRDVDSTEQAENLRILVWALYAGVPMGGMAGFALGHPFLGAVLGPLVIWGGARLVLHVMARGGSLIYMPSGSSTPRDREYSRAEALRVRGDYEGAIRAYEEALEDPRENGEAFLRIARIHRDHLDSPEEALLWFRRATEEAQLPRGKEILARKEMAELLIHRLGQPRRAAPELARLAETRKGTPEGEWAREELARIKEEMTRED
jgi:tetratricopeptide (TPR) repeat protein